MHLTLLVAILWVSGKDNKDVIKNNNAPLKVREGLLIRGQLLQVGTWNRNVPIVLYQELVHGVSRVEGYLMKCVGNKVDV